MQYYDEEAQTFLADRYIVGTCPKCGNERAYGDQCEKCGSTLSPDELIDPHSAVVGFGSGQKGDEALVSPAGSIRRLPPRVDTRWA